MKLTPTQKALAALITQVPGITVQNAAVHMNTSPAGIGIAATRLVSGGIVRREKDNLFIAVVPSPTPADPTPSAADYNGVPTGAENFIRDLTSKIAVHQFSEDDTTDKRAGYLAKVGLLDIIKSMTTPQS